MLKNLLFILSFIPMALHAQKSQFFKAGIHGGLNVNKISGMSYKSGYGYNYQVGLYTQFNITKRIGIQPEVNFVQSTAEFSDDPSDVYYDLFQGGSQKNAKLNMLEVPVFLNLGIDKANRIKLQLGPVYNNNLKETVDSLSHNGNIYKKASWAAAAGVLFQLPIVNFGARYKVGITNINDIDNKEKWTTQAFQVFVGIGF